jgi:ribosomal protein S6
MAEKSIQTDQTEVREYEVSSVAMSETILQDVRTVLEEARALITEEGKTVAIRFAYPIKKQTSGFFGFIKFSAHPETIATIEKNLRVIPQMLRFLIVTPPPARAIESDRRSAMRSPAPQKPDNPEAPALTNEALEQKIEEILK